MPRRWARASALLAWVGTALGATRAQGAEPEPVDRIVAVVGARSPGPGVHLVLHSDVALRARLALLSEGDPDALSRSLPESLQAAMLSQMLGELMLAAEAERLSMAAPEPSEVAVERARLALSVGGEAALLRALDVLDVPAEELGALVLLRATVGGFLDANLERITISDADVARALEEVPPGQPNDPEQVRAQLRQARVESAVASWVTTLAQRVPHRVLED